ncbi:8-oxoguanine DNA glycosylase domain-containing protein [Salinarchaeum sp. Harcht-Bsk1]|uniref:DNA-3-methyladenine glycosylase family protein n=1 Tax=Salinarchaeum sp. Harcht-Bsk1 TaxID=1333523 RepID=UPI00034246C1|nr:8-oxoguanine DNA glycosylase [Salinarchaeum sp. Harcht-Bsk1]AGN02319.1 8-oxoguanine DNA glycosylase domain-containing protein [Salinarchaeum sp. Harcht-Bsk1]
MERGSIDLATLPGGLDLYATLESGQSYGWIREDGRCYEGDGPPRWREPATASEDASTDARSDSPWYVRVVDGDVLRVRQRGGVTDGTLEWEGSADLEADLRRLLRLDDDLPAILESAPDDPLLASAIEYAPGMRLVRDPPFETLIAFICSTQMRVARIHGMVTALAQAYGESVAFDGRTYHAFPEPAALADATEAELRDLGLGYRAPYVQETAELVASGELEPTDALGESYEDARELLTGFVGVGDKVADCILLFSLGYLEAVPLDTWIQTAIAEYYPECDRGNYAETSRAIRERFGGEYAGYVQTYVFHWLRVGPEDV